MIRVERVCTVCGRSISRRRKWGPDGESVEHCSDACRRQGLSQKDRRTEQVIIDLLQRRAPDATICPSEAARAVADGEEWRMEMERVRRAARRLHRAGRIQITQKGQVVSPDRAKGPIRLRLRGVGMQV